MQSLRVITTPAPTGRQNRPGFTLIEVSVVVVLLALLVSIAVTKLRGPYDQAKQQHFRDRIAQLDTFARSYAVRNHVTTIMTFDAIAGRIEIVADSREGLKRLEHLVLGSQLSLARVTTRTSDSPQQKVQIGSLGQTETYALELLDSQGNSNWVVVLGASGQRVPVESRYEVQQLLRTLESKGFDSN